MGAKKLIAAALAAALSLSAAFAQKEYRRYDVGNGLSENCVMSIYQDRQGCMWFSTRDGLNRFNGRDFEIFGSYSTSGKTVFIRSITPHRDGRRMWICSTNRLLLFDPEDGSFRNVSAAMGHGNIVRAEYAPDSGNLLVASDSGLLELSDTVLVRKRLEGREVKRFLVAGDRLFVGCENELLRYDRLGDSFENVATFRDEVTLISLQDTDTILCGSAEGEIAQIDLRSGKVSMLDHEGLYIARIHAFFPDDYGKLAIGADNGLFMYDFRTGTFSQDRSPLGSESIQCIFRDREDGIWIGTYFGGVSYFSPKQKHIEVFRDNGRDGSLRGSAVSDMCEDKLGNIWIATENAGLNYLDRRTGRFVDYTSKSLDNLHALCLDGNKLWIGTFGKGLDCMDTRNGSVRRFDSADGLPDNRVYSIMKGSDGLLYIGTMRGISAFDGRFFHMQEGTGSLFAIDLAEDSAGTIWAACKEYGVWYKRPSGEWQRLEAPDAYFSGVFIDRKGSAWFTTEDKGIFRLGTAGLEHIGEGHGLPRAIYYRILEDADGMLWISSHHGLIRYDHAHGTSVRLTAEDGLQSNQFNFRSGLKTSDGKFWFGGINGLNSFFPFQIETNAIPPIAAIHLVSQHGNTVRINFDCYSYVAPGSNRFSWRMKGWQDGWVETDIPEVSMLHLPPGKYTFELKACNNDGVWSENIASAPVTVKPHPLASPVAFMIYFLVAAAASILTIRALKRSKEEKERLKKEEEDLRRSQETAREKIQFFTQIAHEIKTPATLIQAPLEKVMSEGRWDPAIGPDLETISRNSARLLELIRQLLDFRKVDQEGYKVMFRKCDLNILLRDIAKRFRPSGEHMSLSLEEPDGHIVSMLDEEAVNKIVSNLLSNAVKFASSQIRLRLAREDDEILIRVDDDGPGIPEEYREKVFEPFFQVENGTSRGVGIGLSLVRLLVEKHSGSIEAGQSPEGGCRVDVRLPYLPETEEESILSAPMTALSTGDKASVLIVEDNADMLDFLKRNFEENYNVSTAVDGKEALELLKQRSFDLVLSDIMMPRLDGFELLLAVRKDEMTEHIPFVLLSARDSMDDKIQGLERGADAYIEKPFPLELLKATVRNLIEKRRRIQQHFLSDPEARHHSAGFSAADREWMDKVDAIIKEKMQQDHFSVEYLADAMSISQSNLQRRMKGLTGVSPVDYIRLMRLKEAAALLKEGRYRVSEVCYMVGLNNLSYFTKCFKAQFGILPKDYAGRTKS